MKAALLAVATAGLFAQPTENVVRVPPSGTLPGGQLLDATDKLPLLLGVTSAQAILAHRVSFRDNLAKVRLTQVLKARWKAVQLPYTLVAVFGSWCSDSQAYLPDLLALDADPNPFIEVHYLGVNRDKVLAAEAWPQGCPPRKVSKVPTFYLYATLPGGGQKLVGTVVEDPPRPGQTMAEALVEMVTSGGKSF